jgi:hypothetical protein
MKNLLKTEPVMVFVVAVAAVLSALVVGGVITVEQIDGAVGVFWKVLAIVVLVVGGLKVRASVTPTGKD